MASLTRKFLASIGLEEDKIDLIIEKHNEVCTELKDERDKYKEEAEKLPAVQKELDELKSKTAGDDPYKDKYEELKKEYDNFKADTEAKEVNAKKESAFRHMLKDIGIADKRIDTVLKVSDVDKIELGDDGVIKDAEALKAKLKEEWSDFISTSKTEGAPSANPPSNNGGKTTMTKEEIRKISDPIARQKAMMDNPSLFGLPENN